MSASHSTSHRQSSTAHVEHKDADMAEVYLHGEDSLCGQLPSSGNDQLPPHTHSSPMFEPSPNRVLSASHGDPSFISGDAQHNQAGLQQLPMPTEKDMHTSPVNAGFPSMSAIGNMPLHYTQPFNGAGPHHHSSFPTDNQGGWIPSQDVPSLQHGVYQNDRSPMSDAISVSYWTELHTKIVREGKCAGKRASEIVQELYEQDGILRSTNLINKRWQRMKGSCTTKYERDSITDNVTPVILETVYGEILKLERGQMLYANGQLTSAEQEVKDIAKRHVEKCVNEIVARLFGN